MRLLVSVTDADEARAAVEARRRHRRRQEPGRGLARRARPGRHRARPRRGRGGAPGQRGDRRPAQPARHRGARRARRRPLRRDVREGRAMGHLDRATTPSPSCVRWATRSARAPASSPPATPTPSVCPAGRCRPPRSSPPRGGRRRRVPARHGGQGRCAAWPQWLEPDALHRSSPTGTRPAWRSRSRARCASRTSPPCARRAPTSPACARRPAGTAGARPVDAARIARLRGACLAPARSRASRSASPSPAPPAAARARRSGSRPSTHPRVTPGRPQRGREVGVDPRRPSGGAQRRELVHAEPRRAAAPSGGQSACSPSTALTSTRRCGARGARHPRGDRVRRDRPRGGQRVAARSAAGSRTGVAPAGSGSRPVRITAPGMRSPSSQPNASMARIAIRWAVSARSEKRSSWSRTASASPPPPGTTSSAVPRAGLADRPAQRPQRLVARLAREPAADLHDGGHAARRRAAMSSASAAAGAASRSSSVHGSSATSRPSRSATSCAIGAPMPSGTTGAPAGTRSST